MLTLLSLKDFVIVPRLTVEAESKLTCLTGETGAGKSILIDALELVLGARSDISVIREGADRAEVSAVFTLSSRAQAWLENAGIEDQDGTVIMRRTVDTKGRSRCWLNDTPVTVRQMRDLGTRLVAIHGQLQNQALMLPAHQLQLVDDFGNVRSQLLSVRSCWDAWQKAEHRLTEATEGRDRQQAEAERLSWMEEVLGELAPQEGEWESLSAEHAMLSNAAEISSCVQEALQHLSNGEVNATQLLAAAQANLARVCRFDPSFENFSQALGEAETLIEDTSRDIGRHLDRSEVDATRFTEVDDRVNAYWRLSRKFQRTPEELYTLWQDTKQRLAEIDQSSDVEGLKNEVTKTRKAFMEQACQLTILRQESAKKLSRLVTKQLQTLAMTGGQFVAALTPCEPWAGGLERCEFLVSGHAGAQPRSLTKVASGGELSRISLAIAVITAQITPTPTLIFDEVDAGIGGAVAEVVGSLLHQLGQSRQVLVVTHLPQVAAFGNHQWRVEKHTVNAITTSSLSVLTAQERIEELARMLSGTHKTEAAKKTAKELLLMAAGNTSV